MGDSRGGEGAKHSEATDKVARAVARDALQSERKVSRIVVQRLTEGLYMVELTCFGESGPERYLYAEEDLADGPKSGIPPSGGSGRKRNG